MHTDYPETQKKHTDYTREEHELEVDRIMCEIDALILELAEIGRHFKIIEE